MRNNLLSIYFLSITAIILFSTLIQALENIPEIPCPNIFKYEIGANNVWKGVVKLQRDVDRTTNNLNVVMAVDGLVQNSSINVNFLGLENELLKWEIEFPKEYDIPKLIELKLNEDLMCEGNEDNAKNGKYRTYLLGISETTKKKKRLNIEPPPVESLLRKVIDKIKKRNIILIQYDDYDENDYDDDYYENDYYDNNNYYVNSVNTFYGYF